ncbi:phospholipase a2 activating protein, putative (macronuclear) [Tetrahymena thermophila SB210]|uniref:Phospholipase a2 activating protein, putative n=1 Tax=Tetrahymena thermophila (strain SB210) TaxID=312017 RepID=Q23TB4_TETTS|nr:phospholipase a2 activating protein, putative [Tetrahymena thermophila SB210]EAR99792.1 phospholipase a2 activating protein, putative [Tetrahymena thermophila SB210]|eukprot:XP_001020037.1 phospholipase a2 activating protein, putative [Tetrahymena thermophila SB210]
MDVENSQYFLSQQFAVHTQGARCVDVNNNVLISGSTDKTVKIYSFIDNKYEMISDVNFFDDYVYSVKVNLKGDGFFVGSKDTHIYVLDITGSPSTTLSGHTGPVCSFSQIDNDTLVSGSWDGTARIWDLREGKEVRKFEGHSHAVTVLGVMHLDLLVTGSQDKNLNFFRISTGEKIRTVKEAHTDIIRQIAFIEDVGFLSASNDELLKLWTFDGDLMQQLTGHTAFVFTCACLSFGKYVSGSDDQSIKIWNDSTNIQSILHPGTVWSVTVNNRNHDIITACSDGSVRVFTTDPSRKAPAIEIEDFEKNATVSNAKGPQGLPPDELAKLPDVSQLNQFQGKKEGELKIFKNGGVPEAYSWKQAEQRWEKIGEVLSTIPKKTYHGDEFFAAGDYDYIFDVEDDSGFTKSIPFNEGDNPMEAAEKYCAREGISRANIEQIRQFLMKNTKYHQNQGNQKKPQQNIYAQQQVQQQNKSSIYFPLNQFQYYEQKNLEGLKKKVLEFNEALKAENHPLHLVEKQVIYFNTMIDMLEKTNMYHTSRLNYNEMEVFTVKLINWPKQYMLPIFDLFRIFALHPQSDALFSGVDSGLHYFTVICGGLMSEENNDVTKNVILKILVNLFNQTSGRYGIYKHHKFIIECIQRLRDNQNANLQTTLATLMFNISAEYINNQNHSVDAVTAYVNEIIFLIQKEKNAENLLKYLIACGNFALKSANTAKPLIKIGLSFYQPQINDAKINECLNDLKSIL